MVEDHGGALRAMLAALGPVLQPQTFVFCCVGDAGLEEVLPLAPFACIRETEGLTLVLERGRARSLSLECSAPLRCITLGVYSPLDAVGVTAIVAGIPANVIAGFHHDHVFVPEQQADEALAVLRHPGSGR